MGKKTKNKIWIIGIIVVILIFSIFTITGKRSVFGIISHKIDLFINNWSEEEYCIKTKKFIDTTYKDGICDEGENPFNSADCCLDKCVTQEYEWWCG